MTDHICKAQRDVHAHLSVAQGLGNVSHWRFGIFIKDKGQRERTDTLDYTELRSLSPLERRCDVDLQTPDSITFCVPTVTA